MPEIGATLREARMRARIDIAEIETATKIRAKYLRALENEEWDLLPGPTFVKTFLRTYAEALGLDAKLLVDEYKLRHERLSDTELRPISPRSNTNARSGRAPTRRPGGLARAGGGGSPRIPIAVVLIVAIVAVLFILGATGDDKMDPVPRTEPTAQGGTTGPTTPASSGTAPTDTAEEKPKAKPPASLRVIPTGDVEVCLRAKGRPVALINGVVLRASDAPTTFRSSRFTISLGNSSARLVVNGKTRRPAAASPVGYAITRTGFRRLKDSELPSCG